MGKGLYKLKAFVLILYFVIVCTYVSHVKLILRINMFKLNCQNKLQVKTWSFLIQLKTLIFCMFLGKSVVREESTKVDQRRRGYNVYGVYLSRKIYQNAQEAPL